MTHLDLVDPAFRRRSPPDRSTRADRPAEPEVRLRSMYFTVTPWRDPAVEPSGVDPRDPYVERYWLGVLGPSTVLLLRRFARGLDERPEGFKVPVIDTSLALGLGRGVGRNSPIIRTVDRAETFGMLRRTAHDRIEARTRMPLLSPRQLRQLPPVLRRLHADWLRSQERNPDPR